MNTNPISAIDAPPPLPSADEFHGTVALVTGGTNGLGEHLAQTLVAAGADVFFCGRQVERGQELVRAWGPRAHFVAADLADPEQCRQLVSQAGCLRGRIDYLVNNAAIDPRTPLASATVEDFDRVVAIDLRSYWIIAQAAIPLLQTGTGKAVVNVCTTNYLFGYNDMTIYNAAKSGIIGMSRSLARDLGPAGIRVNVVSPGWIMTERQVREHGFEQAQDGLVRSQALKFPLTPAHVTPVTLFLLSRAAGGVTGQSIVVDGGKFMQ